MQELIDGVLWYGIVQYIDKTLPHILMLQHFIGFTLHYCLPASLNPMTCRRHQILALHIDYYVDVVW